MFPKLTPEGVGLPGLIAIVAVTHVFVAHFAVGGGWYLVLTERLGRKKGLPDVVGHAERHSRFFVLLTLVFGALSGVGIWFTIGLAAPDSTFYLIRTFVWGWATEWCFFLIELTAALVYYKTWRRIEPKVHMAVGWVYAVASIFTLLVINGILSYMLTPGEGEEFFARIFNPSYWPTTVLRIAIAFFVAGCFGLLTSGREAEADTRRLLIARSGRWIATSLLVALPCFIWTKSTLPADVVHLLDRSVAGQRGAVPLLGMLWRLGGAAFAVLFAVGAVVAVMKPRRFPTWAGAAVLLVALFAFGCAEYTREVLRKPFAVRGVIYANGIYAADVDDYRQNGFLQHVEDEGWIESATPEQRGRAMYRHQCSACHTIDGYRGLRTRLAGRGREAVGVLMADLTKPLGQPMIWEAMPPVVGNADEIGALKAWLERFAEESAP